MGWLFTIPNSIVFNFTVSWFYKFLIDSENDRIWHNCVIYEILLIFGVEKKEERTNVDFEALARELTLKNDNIH